MARRSIKEFKKGLEKQIADAKAEYEAACKHRTEALVDLDKEVGEKAAKLDALNAVLQQLGPEPSRKAAKKKGVGHVGESG